MCCKDDLKMRRIYSVWLGIRFVLKAMALPILGLLLNKEFLSTPVCAFFCTDEYTSDGV